MKIVKTGILFLLLAVTLSFASCNNSSTPAQSANQTEAKVENAEAKKDCSKCDKAGECPKAKKDDSCKSECSKGEGCKCDENANCGKSECKKVKEQKEATEANAKETTKK